jgi:hypothetical protein
MKELKLFRCVFTIFHFLLNLRTVFGTCKPFQLSDMKQSSLLGQFVSYEENGVL